MWRNKFARLCELASTCLDKSKVLLLSGSDIQDRFQDEATSTRWQDAQHLTDVGSDMNSMVSSVSLDVSMYVIRTTRYMRKIGRGILFGIVGRWV